MKALLLSPGARLLLVVAMCIVVGVRFERTLVALAVSAVFALAFALSYVLSSRGSE